MSWQWSGKGSAPDPLLVPGQEQKNTTRTRGDVMTIEELHERLGWDPPSG